MLASWLACWRRLGAGKHAPRSGGNAILLYNSVSRCSRCTEVISVEKKADLWEQIILSGFVGHFVNIVSTVL